VELITSGVISANARAIDVTTIAVKTKFIILPQAKSLLQRRGGIIGSSKRRTVHGDWTTVCPFRGLSEPALGVFVR